MNGRRRSAKPDMDFEHPVVMEPYREENGEIGFALIFNWMNPKVQIDTIAGFRRDKGDGFGTFLENEIRKVFWTPRDCPLPLRPDISQVDNGLHNDICEFISRTIVLPEEGQYDVLSCWAVAGWIREVLLYHPRIIAYAPTRTAKSKLLNTLRLIAYRGWKGSSPTAAALHRLIERYHPTCFIDEYHSILNDRRNEIDLVFMEGFEAGALTPKVNQDTKEVDFFNFSGFMAIATKQLPREDMQNRAVLLNMLPGKPQARRMDLKAALGLRTRLLAFRLNQLTQMPDPEETYAKACSIVEGDISVEGENVQLDDRTAEIAATLVTPCLVNAWPDDAFDDILEVIARSQLKADSGLRETRTAEVFFALQAIVERGCSKINDETERGKVVCSICTRDVADQYNQDLKIKGELKGDNDDVPTKVVTGELKTLGFDLRTGGSQNRTYFDKPAKFWKCYHANVTKYGRRGGKNDES